MSTDRIFTARRLGVGSLDASQVDLEVRTPHLRIALRSGRNVASDYGLMNRAAPYMTRLNRPHLLVPLAGRARAEEQGRRVWFASNEFLAIEGGRIYDGTVAWAGDVSKVLLIQWDPGVFGASFDRPFDLGVLSEIDRARLEHAATRAVTEPTSLEGSVEVLAIFRALGVPFEPADLPPPAPLPLSLRRLSASLDSTLSSLARFPAIDDVSSELGWNARKIHRTIRALAERFQIAWTDWRSALHAHRMLAATRLLSAPGATTEGVARLTGFRSPSALCHAFAKAGLPSPGVLARSARGDVLEAWTRAA